VLAPKVQELRCEHVAGEPFAGGQAEHPFEARVDAAERTFRREDLRLDQLCMRREREPCFGERESTRRARKEARVESMLERADATTHGGRIDLHRARGSGVRFVARNSEKEAQIVPRFHDRAFLHDHRAARASSLQPLVGSHIDVESREADAGTLSQRSSPARWSVRANNETMSWNVANVTFEVSRKALLCIEEVGCACRRLPIVHSTFSCGHS